MPQRGTGLRAVQSEDQELDRVLGEMSDEEVVCRSGKHRWALDEVMPGEEWPDVVRAWPERLGVFRIEDPCLCCGLAWRVTDTLPGGELDAYAETHILYDKDWVKVPRGFNRSKRRLRQEKYLRSGKSAVTQVRGAAARTASREREQAPQAVFRGA